MPGRMTSALALFCSDTSTYTKGVDKNSIKLDSKETIERDASGNGPDGKTVEVK